MMTRLAPPVVASDFAPIRYDTLEGLRGCAALIVLYGHLTAPHHALDPAYAPSPVFWFFESSLPAVMVFFILSGFVIGHTNTGGFTTLAAKSYLARRAVRVLPIYLVAVATGWMLSPAADWRTLLGHLLFLQNDAQGLPLQVSLLTANPNLWSLHYEAVYYLAFLILWWARPSAVPVFAGLLLLGGLALLVPGFPPALSWLACGLVYWLAGLAVAWCLPVAAESERSPWPSVVLLAMATGQLNVFHVLLTRLGLDILWVPGVTFEHLASLPSLLWLFLLVVRRRPSWLNRLEFITWSLPVGFIIWRFIRGTWTWRGEDLAVFSMVLTAVLVRRWRPGLSFFRWLAPIGAMSYAVYALGAPVQHFVLRLFPEISGSVYTFAARALLVLLLLFPAAWWLELKLQSGIRGRIARGTGRNPVPQPTSA